LNGAAEIYTAELSKEEPKLPQYGQKKKKKPKAAVL